MDLFRLALKAKLPLVGVHTDDTINLKSVLESLSGKKVLPVPGTNSPLGDLYLWLVMDPRLVNESLYRRLCEAGATAVIPNPSPDLPRNLWFDAGQLLIPSEYHLAYLKEYTEQASQASLLSALQGLSLKTGQEVTQLTMARSGSLTAQEIRKTRMMLTGVSPGLSVLETDYDLYFWPDGLMNWMTLNDNYFLDPVPEVLVPRGLLLYGHPGVGKTMAARALAQHWDVPLFRLDMAGTMNRYLGESESRVARNLQIIESNAPCVFLLDEVEKLFKSEGNEGTPDRILSQLLWWLQERKGRVLTIMTSNNFSVVPKELYRPGRIDRTIELPELPIEKAETFGLAVYLSVVGKPATPRRSHMLRTAIQGRMASRGQDKIAHADVKELVFEIIKSQNWLSGGKQVEKSVAPASQEG